jgi:hypothetical protein
MRTSSILISGAVAAVAVAGSANAAVVHYQALNTAYTEGNLLIPITAGNDGAGATVAQLRFNSYGSGANLRAGIVNRYGSVVGNENVGSSSFAITEVAPYDNPKFYTFGENVEGLGSTQMFAGFDITPSPMEFTLPGFLTRFDGSGPLNNATRYLGFTFFNQDRDSLEPDPASVRYGWVQITGGAGVGFTIVGYAYDTTGAAIAAGMIPAPGAVALLGAAGLLGSRRRR